MEDDSQQKCDFTDLWSDYAKSVMNFWQSSAATWQEFLVAASGQIEQNRDGPFDALNSMWTNQFNREAMQDFRDAGTFAEVAATAARSFSEGYTNFHQWLMSGAGKNESPKDHSFIKTQQDLFQTWTDYHEKEIQPLLRIPQVGLTRFYHEKMNHLVDRFNLYQAAMADFQYLLCRPMESALSEMREKLDKGQNAKPPGDFKEYYATWIKTLERHYSELLTSAEWRQVLCRLVDEAADFKISKNEILMDFIRFLPIPTNRDMDEVFKEIYLLKKMVKQLLKENREQELNAV